MHVRREVVQAGGDVLVAADQPVVAQHGGHGHGQTQRGHDQSFTDRTSDLVDRSLASEADVDQSAIDADHGAEQADERRGRTDRGEEREAGGQLTVDQANRTVQRHRHPLMLVDLVGQATFVVIRSAQAVINDLTERRVLVELGSTGLQVGGGPELLFQFNGFRHDLLLVQIFGDDDEPAVQRHEHQ